MPNIKEKLVELCEDLETLPCCDTYEGQADYLIANGVTVQEWISVKDRLPDVDDDYLACTESGWRGVLSFAKDARKIDEYDFHSDWVNVWYDYDSEWGYYTIDSVTHWMLLPQPPKGE